MTQKLFLCNLGCSKNSVDGDTIAGFLVKNNFILTSKPQDATAIIVNTCTFIEEATQESINTILQYAPQKGKNCKLIVSGCMSERYKGQIANDFPEVDLWLPTDNWRQVLIDYYKLENPLPSRRIISEPLHTQYIKIAEGCSRNCSFCIIPSIKGQFRSESPDKIIEEAQYLESIGVKELILVSQDTSFYGRDIGITITCLLERLLDSTNFRWIRLMYLYPTNVLKDEEFLHLIFAKSRILPYFDIPFQHVCDDILKSMNRQYSFLDLYNLVLKIRRVIPHATLRTTFIVGYPGETKEDFEKLCEFIQWARFDKLGVFPYSPEEGTKAATLPNAPDSNIVNERMEIIMNIQREISAEILKDKIEQYMEIIVDAPHIGRTKGDAPEVDGLVYIEKKFKAKVGDFCQVQVYDSNDYDLLVY